MLSIRTYNAAERKTRKRKRDDRTLRHCICSSSVTTRGLCNAVLCPSTEKGNAVGDASRTSTMRVRALAVVSLVAVLLLAVALIVFLVRNGVDVVVGAAGFALGVAGGWWAITKRAP